MGLVVAGVAGVATRPLPHRRSLWTGGRYGAVSLPRSSDQGGRISLILAFVFPAIIAAAMALAYYGYQGAQDVVASYKVSFVKTAGAQARALAEKVEAAMDLTVNDFFAELSALIEDPNRAEKERCGVPAVPPMVQAFAIYSEIPRPSGSFDCTGPQGRLNAKEAVKLNRQITLDHSGHFEWSNISQGKLKYVHLSAEGGLLFAVAKYRATDNESYFLVARLDLGHIRGHLLMEELRNLGRTYRVALVDPDRGTLPEMVFGGSEPRTNEQFIYNEQFGKILHAWNVRLAHQEDEMLKLEERLEWEKVIQPLFVVLSTIIIAVGMGIVMLSVVAERRASRLKSDFIANVSHELKTPLSLIRMFGEMVATGRHKGEEMVREYGGIITRESERLSHLIDNVLDFARLERGKASYDFLEGDLSAVLERALDVSRYRLEKDRISLRTRVDRNLPPVRMDDNAITLVILNLVDNAIKYGAEGGAVEVSLDRAPGGVVLAVRDFGAGIPRDEQARIFERFYRAQSARDRNVRGSGIGLSLVRHIAEAHGGRVSIESPVRGATGPENGSVFRVFLPAPVVAGADSDVSADASVIMGAGSSEAAADVANAPSTASGFRPLKP